MSVQRRGTMHTQPFYMLLSAVSFVALPPVMRPFSGCIDHDPVAPFLSHNRCRRNARLAAITANYRPDIRPGGINPHRASPRWCHVSIDQNCGRRSIQHCDHALHRQRHGEHCRPQNIQLVDLCGFNHSDRPNAALANFCIQHRPAFRRQFL